MEGGGKLNREPSDNSLASFCQNDITESLITQPIPINIRIAQDIQEFLCQAGKPFLCPYCRREFAREWSYHQHLQKYHNDCVNSAPVTCIENLEG